MAIAHVGAFMRAGSNTSLGRLADVDINRCIAMINHQTTGDINEQFECARSGYSGNAAWPRPVNVPLPPNTMPSQPAFVPSPLPSVELAPLIVPPDPAFTSPAHGATNVLVPSCQNINDWLSNNPMFAIGILAAVYFIKRG